MKGLELQHSPQSAAPQREGRSVGLGSRCSRARPQGEAAQSERQPGQPAAAPPDCPCGLGARLSATGERAHLEHRAVGAGHLDGLARRQVRPGHRPAAVAEPDPAAAVGDRLDQSELAADVLGAAPVEVRLVARRRMGGAASAASRARSRPTSAGEQQDLEVGADARPQPAADSRPGRPRCRARGTRSRAANASTIASAPPSAHQCQNSTGAEQRDHGRVAAVRRAVRPAERLARDLADAAERAEQRGRLERQEQDLLVGRGGELAERLDVFLRDEVVDRLDVAARRSPGETIAVALASASASALARLGIAERGFLAALGLEDLRLLLALGLEDRRLRASPRPRGSRRASRARPSSAAPWRRRGRAAARCP